MIIHYHFLFFVFTFPINARYSTVTVSSAGEVSPLTVVNPDLHFFNHLSPISPSDHQAR